jgi:ElaB/YqjD/DUF883 family membrane-anchored ribosome-binding protein
MAERKSRIDVDAVADETPSKAQLQQQMEEARESISETVAQIRETVTNQYEAALETVETVKETVTEVLDWREKFKENPMVWGAGAVSVGILIGLGIAHSVGDDHSKRRRKQSEIAAIAETLLKRVAHLGDAVLPVISGQLKEMFGIDIADYLHPTPEPPKRIAAKKSAKRRATAGKSSSKKRSARKSVA